MRGVRREKRQRQKKAGDVLSRKMLSNARVIAKGERIRFETKKVRVSEA